MPSATRASSQGRSTRSRFLFWTDGRLPHWGAVKAAVRVVKRDKIKTAEDAFDQDTKETIKWRKKKAATVFTFNMTNFVNGMIAVYFIQTVIHDA